MTRDTGMYMQRRTIRNRGVEVRWGGEGRETITKREQVYDTKYIKICWRAQRMGVHFEVGLTTGSKITAVVKRLGMENGEDHNN